MQIAFFNTHSNNYISIHDVNELVGKTLWNWELKPEHYEKIIISLDKSLPDWYTILVLTILNSGDGVKGKLKLTMEQLFKNMFHIDLTDEDLYDKLVKPHLSILDFFNNFGISIVQMD